MGADVGYHFLPRGEWEPWLELGTGLEWASYRVGTEDGQAESSYFGFAFRPEHVQSTGRDDLPRPAPHFWLIIGARGVFQL